MNRYLIVLLTLMLLSLSGCNQSSDAPAEAEAEALIEMPGTIPELVLCMDPRPEMCAQNYAPVCGQHEDGSRLTYSNSCTACSNVEVVGSVPGACPE